jgi:predicted metal-binding membrane protein
MNLAWVAAVAIYVAFEKLLPHSPWLSRAAGAGLIAAGGVVLALGLGATASASL